MGIRRTLAELLRGRPDDSRLVQIVEEALAARAFAGAAEVAALEARVAKLEKKLDMAMGAVNAATAQLMQVKSAVEEAGTLARQARQEATSARNTAESVAEGLGPWRRARTRTRHPRRPPPPKPRPKLR